MAADGQPRTYTAAEREEALRLYLDLGPAEAGRRLDIPAGTIRQWAKRGGLTNTRLERGRANVEAARLTWAQRRAEVARRAGDAAALFVEDAIASDKARDRRDLMASFKMASEGAQLLSGEATGRVEFSETEVRAEVRRMRDELAARREQKRAAGAADA